jgi:PAS domain S-box-containing protein
MSIANLSQKLPSLGSIVDRQPLIVATELSLVEVISLMSQAKGHTCLLSNSNSNSIPSNNVLEISAAARHSSVLVTANRRLIGIFTERDLVKLTASQIDLQSVTVGDVMTRDPITLELSENHTVMTALAIFQQHQIRHLPILDDRQQLIGIVTPEHIRQVLQPINLLKLRSIADVITRDVIHAPPTTTILAIAQMMNEGNIGSIVIVDGLEQLQPVGIITERDIVQFQAFGLDLDQLLAAAVMSSPLFCLPSTASLWAAQQIMQTKNIRRLVIATILGELEGIITQSDLLHSLDPAEMLYMVENLQLQLLDRATELENTNRELQAEVARREHVEAELRRASQTLEERVVTRTAELAMLTAELHIQIAKQQSCNISLEASQQGISDFIENASIGMHWVDIHGNIVWVNRAELAMFGYDRSAYIGQPLMNFHVARSKVADLFQRLLKNESIEGYETQVYRQDGSICDVSIDAHAFFNDGKFIHARCFTRDITDKKNAEASLQASRFRYRALVMSAPVGIFQTDAVGYSLFFNQQCLELMGVPLSEALGHGWANSLHPDDFESVSAQWNSAVQSNREFTSEYRFVTPQGRVNWVFAKAIGIYDEAGTVTGYIGTLTDITEKKSLEQQFLRAQRLESLGSLASGIAHDLNNVLTPIVGASQLLPLTLPNLDARNQRLLNMLVESSKRGSGLVKQILSFAKGMDGERTILQVRHILTEIISVARQTFPPSIEINLNLVNEDLWLVNVDATQIHQVLMNLFVNARDAMPNGGQISASVENIIINAEYLKLHFQPPVGAYILMTIADTGIGMTSEILERIFEPFFTTKETGTGLGLSTVKGIIKAHGGSIDVESEVGQGTSFKIYLPAILPLKISNNSREAETLVGEDLYDGKGQLVLVVDDELAIREITKESLETYNYRVMLASDGIEAIDIYARNHHSIAIVLVDMMMPQLDTPSIILALKQIDPKVKIVVMSGSALNLESVVDGQSIGAVLNKPFTTAAMLQTLAEIQIAVQP